RDPPPALPFLTVAPNATVAYRATNHGAWDSSMTRFSPPAPALAGLSKTGFTRGPARAAFERSESVGIVAGKVPSKSALVGFLRAPRYEVLPTEDVEGLVNAYIPHEVTITITASPRRGIDATVNLADRP